MEGVLLEIIHFPNYLCSIWTILNHCLSVKWFGKKAIQELDKDI